MTTLIHPSLVFICSCVFLSCFKAVPAATKTSPPIEKQKEFFQRPGVNATEILRAHGYHAKNYKFITDDGYVLYITRGRNPLIKNSSRRNNKKPILFVHGFSSDSTSFLANSFGAQARDLSHLDLNRMSLDEAIKLLAEDETSNSLPMLAMNLGHEVWLLHRRGTQLSRERLAQLDWDTPLSAQEKLERVAEMVKGRTGGAEGGQVEAINKHATTTTIKPFGSPNQRRPLIGTHLTDVRRIFVDPSEDPSGIMSSIRHKKPARKKLSKLLPAIKAAPLAMLNHFKLVNDIQLTSNQRFWNYSMDEQAAYDIPNAIDAVRQVTGHDKVIMIGDSSGGAIVIMSLILNPEMNEKLAKVVAWAPAFVLGHSDSVKGSAWVIPLLQAYNGPYPLPFLTYPMQATMQIFCGLEIMQNTLCEFIENKDRGRSNGQTPISNEYYSNYFVPVSSKEAAQLLQFAKNTKPQMYDHGTSKNNLNKYGHIEPPEYDLGFITFDKLSIWASTTDSLVSPDDINQLIKHLRVPHKLFVIDQPDITFNHGSLFYHVKVDKLAVIPTLKDMEDPN